MSKTINEVKKKSPRQSPCNHFSLLKKSVPALPPTNTPQFAGILFLLSNCLSRDCTIINILPWHTFCLRTSLGRTQDCSLSLLRLRLQQIQKSASCGINLAHSSPFLMAEKAFDPTSPILLPPRVMCLRGDSAQVNSRLSFSYLTCS